MIDKLDRLERCLRVLKLAGEVKLTEGEFEHVRKMALEYLHAELSPEPSFESLSGKEQQQIRHDRGLLT